MRLDPDILADLAVSATLTGYIRVLGLAYAPWPLGAGYGPSRFSSPLHAFKVVYLAGDLTTAVAETLVRDRFQGRADRRLMRAELDRWGATEVTASGPLTVIDLRTTGLVRLGVSTEAARGKAQGQGRKLAQAIHDQTDAAGVLYTSRLTARPCVCLFDRSLPGPLTASPVVEIARLAGLVPALRSLAVELIA